jgi:transcriptional regulator with XRE-family HTH domain
LRTVLLCFVFLLKKDMSTVNEIANIVSYNIYALKTDLRLSYEKIGQDVGLDDKSIMRIVHQRRDAKISEVAKLADYFNVNFIDFITKKVG